MKDEEGINRKLFLLSEVYEVFSYGKIIQTIIDLEEIKLELDKNIELLEQLEIMLINIDEDVEETSDRIRILNIQRMYLIENIKTFKDAFSLYEDKLIQKVHLPETDGFSETSIN